MPGSLIMSRMLCLALAAGALVGCQSGTTNPNARHMGDQPLAGVAPQPAAPQSASQSIAGGETYLALIARNHTNIPTAVTSEPGEDEDGELEFGPPPPGYFRILGESVPGWTPESVIQRNTGPLAWQPIGPRPIENEYWSGTDDASGRVVSIAPHPSNGNVVYIASASGGVWKTTNGGASWAPISDELPNLNHGCVVLDPSAPDTVYAGTGEYTTYATGDGLFRSLDGGATWSRIATTDQVGSTCSGIIIDPTNSNRIHVSGDRGYVRSPDGGSTWSLKLSGPVSSIAMNPDDPNILYAGRHGDGVYRSTDRGRNWTKLTNGLPTSDVSRVLVAVAPSHPSTVYAAIINNSAGLRGLYRSTNGGDTWTEKTNTPNFPTPQGWYDAFIGVDPTDENTVYCGGVFPSYAVAGVIRSTNGGDSWTDITYGPGAQLHPDQHTIAFGPDGTVWVGNDGGVWSSPDDGDTWVNRNATLTITQNYNIALHPTDPAQVMTGTQDNGTISRFMDVFGWPQILSGDGGFLAYDQSDPTRVYVTYVYLSVYRIDNNGFAGISGPWDNDSRNFIAPLVMDPSDSDTLLGGTNRVWRTHNASTSADWTAISNTAVSGGGTLNAIAVAPSDSQTIYVGSTATTVYVTTNDGANWFNRSNNFPPDGQVSDIVIDPNDPAHAFVGFYRTGGKRLMVTTDYGQNWTSVGGLPVGVSARALAIDWARDPLSIYVGTGVGVYSSFDGGASWAKDGDELPNVNIGDLAIDPVNRTITVGTYGRGAWRAPLPAAAVPGDVDGDGDVDISDLGLMLSAFGACSGDAGYNAGADLDGSGCINISDLGVLLANFGA